jgi:hypothetical protein
VLGSKQYAPEGGWNTRGPIALSAPIIPATASVGVMVGDSVPASNAGADGEPNASMEDDEPRSDGIQREAKVERRDERTGTDTEVLLLGGSDVLACNVKSASASMFVAGSPDGKETGTSNIRSVVRSKREGSSAADEG